MTTENEIPDVQDTSAADRPAEHPAEPTTNNTRRRSLPKSPITREQADAWGRAVAQAMTTAARFLATVARGLAGLLRQFGGAIAAVPTGVRLLFVVGILTLAGVVGSISIDSVMGLVCAVIVVPVGAAIIGSLGHRWYLGLGLERPAHSGTESAESAEAADTPELNAATAQRSLEYVDRKLALALTSFGTERHQHAVIALFQAKTAIELTLGTEANVNDSDGLLLAEGPGPRPRIRPGAATQSLLRESASLAAS